MVWICILFKQNDNDHTRLAANLLTVLVIIELTKFPVPVRLCCGSSKMIFINIVSCFAIFKNVVHSLKPG